MSRKNPITNFTVIFLVAAAALGIAAIRVSWDANVVARGNFHPVAHSGQGTAEIISDDMGRTYLRISEFRTYPRPGLIVMLISAADALENETVKRSEMFIVGPLKQHEGTMRYELPRDIDLSRYKAVTIWNRRYEVNYTTAPLSRVKEDSK